MFNYERMDTAIGLLWNCESRLSEGWSNAKREREMFLRQYDELHKELARLIDVCDEGDLNKIAQMSQHARLIWMRASVPEPCLTMSLSDGEITLDNAPDHWMFNRKLWEDGSYLWLSGRRVTFSFLSVKKPGTGTLSRLKKEVEADGYEVAVPTPSPHMREILKHWGFKMSYEPLSEEDQTAVEVWTKA